MNWLSNYLLTAIIGMNVYLILIDVMFDYVTIMS